MAPYRLSLSALLIGLSFSQPALPLGFGDLQLQSQLNQPLQAEIPILGVPAYAVDSVKVRLGKREDFAALGYDYLPEIDDVRTEVLVRDNRLVLQLSSRRALREPLLNLVLVAEEGSTRYLRDYAVLLDLPGTVAATASTPVIATGNAAASQAPAQTSPVSPAPTENAANAATNQPAVVAAPRIRSASTQAATGGNDAAVSAGAETVYGPTRPGESLSTIAHRLGKARGEEWHAFGAALYQANRDAFIAGDPNRLKMAMALKIPTAAAVQNFQRRDWLALFSADSNQLVPAQTATGTAATSETVISKLPQPDKAVSTGSVAGSAPATVSKDVNLQQLQLENLSLKNDLQAATARLQALESQLNQLDSRYAELMQRETARLAATSASAADTTVSEPAAVPTLPESATTATAAVAPETAPQTATESANASDAAPVVVQVNDTLAAPAVASEPATVTTDARTSAAEPWRGVIWGLLTVFALSVAGVLFWQWSERRQQHAPVRSKPRAPREPRPVLPLVDAEESVQAPIDANSPDRRTLKLKQVQAALETYVSYQRFDRALEMLEQEMHIAGDDLMLRRQLQRLQKQVRHDQLEWQQEHQEQLSEQFDRATVTHVDKPVSRDDGKKTSG